MIGKEISLKSNKIRYAEYYGMVEQFDQLYQRSKDGYGFKKLMGIITSEENILLAYRTIKKNTGSKTASIDNLTIQDVEKLSLPTFLEIVQKRFRWYNPRKVRRVDIPKPNGKTRPLGIPSIWDRIIQQCILQILEPICEAKFYKHSYGFRPNRSAEHALATCAFRMNRSHMNYVVDIDIKGFFDEVNHSKLMRQLWNLGIRDKQLLVIIRKMLKAPIVLQNGEIFYPTKGTPQGGILSPLLANINLNEFDWWIANQWEERSCRELKKSFNKKGVYNRGHSYRKLRSQTSLKEMYLVRYCDDFKVFCRTKQEANKAYHAIKMWLEERLKLPISEEKSCITDLRKNTSEFLGFTLMMVPKGNKEVCFTHISPKARKRIKRSLKDQMKKIKQANDIKEIQKYNSMVIGIHNYYQKATHVFNDLRPIGYQMMIGFYNSFKNQGISKNGKYTGRDKGIKKYLVSKQLRYLYHYPILPIDHIQTKHPMNKKESINKYTPEGRKQMHSKQKAVSEMSIQWLRQNPVFNDRATVEYNDNRISLYVAQKGKCAITGVEMDMNDIHCHHKTPWITSKDDSYRNLVLVTSEVHRLIHATNQDVIKNKLNNLNLTTSQLYKLNRLRLLAGTFKLTHDDRICSKIEQMTLF